MTLLKQFIKREWMRKGIMSIKVGSSFFTDLVYADDTTLFATSSQSAVESLSSFQTAASVLGMHIMVCSSAIS